MILDLDENEWFKRHDKGKLPTSFGCSVSGFQIFTKTGISKLGFCATCNMCLSSPGCVQNHFVIYFLKLQNWNVLWLYPCFQSIILIALLLVMTSSWQKTHHSKNRLMYIYHCRCIKWQKFSIPVIVLRNLLLSQSLSTTVMSLSLLVSSYFAVQWSI